MQEAAGQIYTHRDTYTHTQGDRQTDRGREKRGKEKRRERIRERDTVIKNTYRLKEKNTLLMDKPFSKSFNGISQAHRNHATRKGWPHAATGVSLKTGYPQKNMKKKKEG